VEPFQGVQDPQDQLQSSSLQDQGLRHCPEVGFG
jgi:hypothetical protein